MCRPNGYYSVVDHTDFSDLWAFCVLRLVIRFNNSGPDPDDILYDQPLGCAATCQSYKTDEALKQPLTSHGRLLQHCWPLQQRPRPGRHPLRPTPGMRGAATRQP